MYTRGATVFAGFRDYRRNPGLLAATRQDRIPSTTFRVTDDPPGARAASHQRVARYTSGWDCWRPVSEDVTAGLHVNVSRQGRS